MCFKSRLSDEKLWNDYQELQMKITSQQQIIDSQNEMLDEAQSLMQQLRVKLVLSYNRRRKMKMPSEKFRK